MTPLALRFLREFLQPESKRRLVDTGNIVPQLAGIHCFEVSAINGLARDLAARSSEEGFDWNLTFLPFPRTWLEFRGPAGTNERNAFLLSADHKDLFWHARLRGDDVVESSAWQFMRPSLGEEYRRRKEQKRAQINGADSCTTEEMLLATLSIINTPRIVARDEQPPHKGLVRDLRRAGWEERLFPVHASATIRLDVEHPVDGGSGEAHGRLAGPRALHWCRAHLRLQHGKIVLVKAHQRGSPNIGTRDSDYAIKASTA